MYSCMYYCYEKNPGSPVQPFVGLVWLEHGTRVWTMNHDSYIHM